MVKNSRADDGQIVGQIIIDEAASRNAVCCTPGASLGPVGVVVGATIGPTTTDFAALRGSILAPGIGAQGGTAADLPAVFRDATELVLPSTSREVMSAGPTPAGLRAAATRVLGEMKAVIRLR